MKWSSKSGHVKHLNVIHDISLGLVTGYVLYPEYQFQFECSKDTLSDSINQPTGQCKDNIANPSTGQIRLTFIGSITEYPSNHLFCSCLIVFRDVSAVFGIHGYSIDSLCLNEISEQEKAFVARYNQPSVVHMYAISPTQAIFGAGTVNCRCNMLGATGKLWLLFVVALNFFRYLAWTPASFIKVPALCLRTGGFQFLGHTAATIRPP